MLKSFTMLKPECLKQIATELGVITGTPWKCVDASELIREVDNLKLWVRLGGYGNEGKVSISLYRPFGRDGRSPTLYAKDHSGHIPDPVIRVTDKKVSSQIAKDIVRRLLPDAENVFNLANESIANDNKFLDNKADAIAKLSSAVGAKPEKHYQSGELTGKIDPYIGAGIPSFKRHGYGHFMVSGKDSITLELNSMDLETALEVADALRGIFYRNRANEA